MIAAPEMQAVNERYRRSPREGAAWPDGACGTMRGRLFFMHLPARQYIPCGEKESIMRSRGNIILQYSIATFAIIFVVAVALGITLASQITDYQLRSHIRLYPELISLLVKQNAHIPTIFQSPSGCTRSADADPGGGDRSGSAFGASPYFVAFMQLWCTIAFSLEVL
jgi:hypothetical protein